MMPDPLDEGPTLVDDDHMLLIMEALARNNEASALALTEPIPEQFRQTLADYDIGERDAIKILYDHGDWNDRGEAFADVYRSGTDYLWATRDDGDNLVLAHDLTQQLIDRTLDPLRWEIPTLTHALAQDLALHHMEDLQRGAYANVQTDPDAGGLTGTIDRGSDQVSDRVFLYLGNNELGGSAPDDLGARRVVRRAARRCRRLPAGMGRRARRHSGRQHLGGRESARSTASSMNAADLERFEDFDSDNSATGRSSRSSTPASGLIPSTRSISTVRRRRRQHRRGSDGVPTRATVIAGERRRASGDAEHLPREDRARLPRGAGFIDTPPPPVEVDEDGRPDRGLSSPTSPSGRRATTSIVLSLRRFGRWTVHGATST